MKPVASEVLADRIWTRGQGPGAPELDEKGKPEVLFTGVCPTEPHGAVCYTHAQKIGAAPNVNR